jgi:hypothetical protein
MKVQLPKESIYIVAHVKDFETPDIIAAFKTKQSAEKFIKACQKKWAHARIEGDEIELVGEKGSFTLDFDGYTGPNDLKIIESETNGIDTPFFNK